MKGEEIKDVQEMGNDLLVMDSSVCLIANRSDALLALKVIIFLGYGMSVFIPSALPCFCLHLVVV